MQDFLLSTPTSGTVSRATAHAVERLILGRYRPLRPLGAGGSGSVWLARDERSGLEVALKVVARDGKAGVRAEREALAASRLRHRRCLRAYSLARDERHVYIAYEYVRGRTLREVLRAGELRDADAVEAAAQVLEALAHAHARRIVHRDVKPANVLLEDAEGVSVRLLDFGLAAIEDAGTLTARGDVPGTLAYIAPERLGGAPATAASDVWAVGVMLWEALAGEHPFWRSSVIESARAIEAGAPPLAAARPDLPKRLLGAVDAALAVDASARPAAAKLAGALRASGRTRRRTRDAGGRSERPSATAAVERLAPAALAALVAGGVSAGLPFYPAGFPPAVALVAGATAFLRPRAGLALALAVPLFPLGNVSQGLALLYGAFALLWLGLFSREPRYGLVAAAGPLLAPLGALGLAPLLAQPLRSPVRRAAAAASAVLLGALVAAMLGRPLPLAGGRSPRRLGLDASENPLHVARLLGDTLTAQPGLIVLAAVLALAAAVLPIALARGPWGVAGFGAGLLVLALLPSREVHPVPIVAAVWVMCAALWAWERLHKRERYTRPGGEFLPSE